MKGVKKRITISFVAVAVLLFFSGLISFFELKRLSSETESILVATTQNFEIATKMLDLAHQENQTVVDLTVLSKEEADSVHKNTIRRMHNLLVKSRKIAMNKELVDSMSMATDSLEAVVNAFSENHTNDKSENAYWYYMYYNPRYKELVSLIRSYISSTQDSLLPRTEQLKRNAYRSVTPVLISLLVMVAIVLMLFYFVMIYLAAPIVRMNASLAEYLKFKAPFAYKGVCRDEVFDLKENIETLIKTKQVKP